MSDDARDRSASDEFEAALLLSGLQVEGAEREHMREGYLGLKGLLARIPRDLPMDSEPATIAVPPGARSTR